MSNEQTADRGGVVNGDVEALAEAINAADSILSLLRHRGLIDSPMNREDVARASDALASLRPRGGSAGDLLAAGVQAARAEDAARLAAVEAVRDTARDLVQEHMHGPRPNPTRAGAWAAVVRELDAALRTPDAAPEEEL